MEDDIPFKNIRVRLFINEFKCNVCSASFESFESLRSHKKHHVIRNYKCSTCSRRFSKKFHLLNHMERNKHNIVAFCCYPQSLRFEDLQPKDIQMKSVQPKDIQPDSVQSKDIQMKSVQPKVIDLTDEKEIHECPECTAIFSSELVYNMHLRLHAECAI